MTAQQSACQETPRARASTYTPCNTSLSVFPACQDVRFHSSAESVLSGVVPYLHELAIKNEINRARILLYNSALCPEPASVFGQIASSDDQKYEIQHVPITLMNGIDLTMTKQEHAMITDLTTTSTSRATMTPISDDDKCSIRPCYSSVLPTEGRDPAHCERIEDRLDSLPEWQVGGKSEAESIKVLAKPGFTSTTKPAPVSMRLFQIEDIFDFVAASDDSSEANDANNYVN